MSRKVAENMKQISILEFDACNYAISIADTCTEVTNEVVSTFLTKYAYPDSMRDKAKRTIKRYLDNMR